MSSLQTEDYEGEEGNPSHITRVQTGEAPIDFVRDLLGVSGERPGEHRNRQGAQWQAFLADIASNGITTPIFITVDPGQPPQISEGNHRRDAAVELGLSHVPVEIRYFGHAERQSKTNVEQALIQASKSIKHCGDYGELWWNPDTQTAFWVAGDADGEPEYTSLEEIKHILSVPGVKHVEIGDEGGPDDRGHKGENFQRLAGLDDQGLYDWSVSELMDAPYAEKPDPGMLKASLTQLWRAIRTKDITSANALIGEIYPHADHASQLDLYAISSMLQRNLLDQALTRVEDMLHERQSKTASSIMYHVMSEGRRSMVHGPDEWRPEWGQHPPPEGLSVTPGSQERWREDWETEEDRPDGIYLWPDLDTARRYAAYKQYQEGMQYDMDIWAVNTQGMTILPDPYRLPGWPEAYYSPESIPLERVKLVETIPHSSESKSQWEQTDDGQQWMKFRYPHRYEGRAWRDYTGSATVESMAQQSGDPELDAAIEAFKQVNDLSQELGPEWFHYPDTDPVKDYRDPEMAAGNCGNMAEAFNAFMRQRGIDADFTGGDLAGLGYGDAPDVMTERQRFGPGGSDAPAYPSHCVSIVKRPSGTYMVDFTASQYGYDEFPMVQKLDQGAWQRKWSMAERTGIPEVDRLIEDFRKETVQAYGDVGVDALRDPQNSHGMCQAVTEQFVEFAKQRGFKAYTTNTNLEEMGYKPSIEPFGEIGFNEHDEMQYGFYPEHTVATIVLDDPNYAYGREISIDFTASQYGYTDHPKVTSSWSTSAWVVTLSDGSTKSTYAGSAEQAQAQIERLLQRQGLDLTVVNVQPWKPKR